MGGCYSTRRDTNEDDDEEDDRWWKSKSGRKIKITDLKFKSGGGGGGAASERGLHQVPGRLFANGATTISSLYTQQGKKGTNQDAMLFWENFSSTSDTVFCGVFDGHGPYGHMVARKVRDSLPVLLSTQWKATSSTDQSCINQNGNGNGSTHDEELLEDNWSEQLVVEEKGKLPEMYQPLKKSMLQAFKLMDKELNTHPSIDCFCSGTTCVALVKQGQDLVIGNVGDSRAVLATRDKENSLVAVQLTVDLKPNLPREEARIKQFKGRVFALQDEPEVARVWLPHSDSPGLAMARAFGDFCLKDFGLISVPDIYYHRIAEKDEFIVLATDGVWDVLSNKEVVDIVASAPSRSTAARALVDCATRAWRLKYPTSKNDDCAAVCLFLDHNHPLPTVTEKEVKSDIGHIEEDEVKEISVISDTEEDGQFDSQPSVLEHSGAVRDATGHHEIVPDIVESTEEKIPEKIPGGGSKRSLAECISTAEDEEWSALEGVVRVNSLLSLPRFLSVDKRSTSWRKATAKI